jgi:hypothetical protein
MIYGLSGIEFSQQAFSQLGALKKWRVFRDPGPNALIPLSTLSKHSLNRFTACRLQDPEGEAKEFIFNKIRQKDLKK